MGASSSLHVLHSLMTVTSKTQNHLHNNIYILFQNNRLFIYYLSLPGIKITGVLLLVEPSPGSVRPGGIGMSAKSATSFTLDPGVADHLVVVEIMLFK